MNNFLSSALSFANAGIFCLIAFGCAMAVNDENLELFSGILIVGGAAIACGFVATLMVIRDHLENIKQEINGLNFHARNIYSLLKNNNDQSPLE